MTTGALRLESERSRYRESAGLSNDREWLGLSNLPTGGFRALDCASAHPLLESCWLGRGDGLVQRANDVVSDIATSRPEVLTAKSTGPARRTCSDLHSHPRPARRRRR
jgi:hypothetical protein